MDKSDDHLCGLLGGNVTGNDTLEAICGGNATDEDTGLAVLFGSGGRFRGPLMQSHPVVAIAYVILVGLALVIGVLGNTLILMVSGMVRSVNRVGRAFIVNLALADLCVAGIADPLCIVAVLKGEEWFDDKGWFCDFIASLCLTACFCAFLSLTLVSVNRFVFVCHNSVYDKMFGNVTCFVLCIGAWVMAFLFEFPNHMGWGDHYFDRKSHQCIWDRTASFSYTVTVSVGLIGSPLLVMALCYILIFRHIFKTKMNVYGLEVDNPDRMEKVWQETLRTSRTLFVVFLVFVICWVPYAIVIVLDVADKMIMETLWKCLGRSRVTGNLGSAQQFGNMYMGMKSYKIHLFVTLLAHLHSSSNFVIYTTFNSSFRAAVLHVLGCQVCIRRSVDSDTKSTELRKSQAAPRKEPSL